MVAGFLSPASFTTATESHHSLIFHRLPVAQRLNYIRTHTEASISVRLKIKPKATVPSLSTKLHYKTAKKNKHLTWRLIQECPLSNGKSWLVIMSYTFSTACIRNFGVELNPQNIWFEFTLTCNCFRRELFP